MNIRKKNHLQNQAVMFGDRSKSQFSKLFFGPQKNFHTQTFLCVEKKKDPEEKFVDWAETCWITIKDSNFFNTRTAVWTRQSPTNP